MDGTSATAVPGSGSPGRHIQVRRASRRFTGRGTVTCASLGEGRYRTPQASCRALRNGQGGRHGSPPAVIMSSLPKQASSSAACQAICLMPRTGPLTGRASGYHCGTGPANFLSWRNRAACCPAEMTGVSRTTSSRPPNATVAFGPAEPSSARQPTATSAQPRTVHAAASAFGAGTLTAAEAAAIAHACASGAATCVGPGAAAPGPSISLPIPHEHSSEPR